MPFKVDVVRDRATLAREVEDGVVENLYRLQVMNAAESTQRFVLDVQGIEGLRVVSPSGELALGPAEARWVTVALRLPPDAARALGAGAHPMRFAIRRVVSSDAPSHAPSVSAAPAERPLLEKSTFVVPR